MMNTTAINTGVAIEHGKYAGVLYAFLQRCDEEAAKYGYLGNVRAGREWIASMTLSEIKDKCPVFPDKKTIWLAAEKLKRAGLILTDTTGTFSRSRDFSTWWHPVKSLETARYREPKQRIVFDTDDAQKWGIAVALILSYLRVMEEGIEGYKELSPAAMAKVLPLDVQAIARHLKAMCAAGVITRHAKKRTFYWEASKVAKQSKWNTEVDAVPEGSVTVWGFEGLEGTSPL